MRRPGAEVILPLPCERSKVPRATQFRSTWLLSSQQSLRERGLFDRYLAVLPPDRHQAVLFCVAGVWLPLEIARVHYEACDRLGLTAEEQVAMGMTVGKRAQGTILATAVAMAKTAGVTPWSILPHYDRPWRRAFDGGAAAVHKLGPKEARIEVIGCDLFALSDFRRGFRGVLLDMGALFAQRAYVQDLTKRDTRDEGIFRFQWA